MSEPISVVIAAYDGATQLDFTGPHQFLSRTPDLDVRVASLGGRPITADRLVFSELEDLATIASCDVLLVPGGGGGIPAIENELYMKEIVRLGGTARYLTSVCSGSLILGAAGLLTGRRAACHWAWRELLPVFGAIVDEGRIVRDGNILSGGGVTAGIDFVLALIAELRGPARSGDGSAWAGVRPPAAVQLGAPGHSSSRNLGGGKRAHSAVSCSTARTPRDMGGLPQCLSPQTCATAAL